MNRHSMIARLACRTFERGFGFDSIRQKWRWHYRATRLQRWILAVFILFAATGAVKAEIDPERLADAIYIAEGGAKAKAPYGILSVKVKSKAEARAICIRTIRHAMRDFPGISDHEFILKLADRYCPPSADPKGNANWKRNVIALYLGKK